MKAWMVAVLLFCLHCVNAPCQDGVSPAADATNSSAEIVAAQPVAAPFAAKESDFVGKWVASNDNLSVTMAIRDDMTLEWNEIGAATNLTFRARCRANAGVVPVTFDIYEVNTASATNDATGRVYLGIVDFTGPDSFRLEAVQQAQDSERMMPRPIEFGEGTLTFDRVKEVEFGAGLP